MSNDKVEATFHGGEPDPDQEHLTNETPPPAPPPHPHIDDHA